MFASLRVPKPAYLLSQLRPRRRPDSELQNILLNVVDSFQLGELLNCYRAPRSNSLNFILTTTKGKFVFREHSLSEETVAHEHQVLSFLQQRKFPVPQMMVNQAGQAWIQVNGSLCSVYRFVEGFAFTNFIWKPSTYFDLVREAGRTLARYHKAVSELRPTFYKWDAYQATEHRRWRDGNLYRQAFETIRSEIEDSATVTPIDQFVQTHIDELEIFLAAENRVEECTDLTKLVIHGDYAPWNLLYRPNQAPFILDFNSARLDLKIFDIILATFFFAWRDNHLHPARAMAFQQGYAEVGQVSEIDVQLADQVFQWLQGRSVAERLRVHYLEQRLLPTRAIQSMEKYHQMCLFAGQNPKQLVAGLIG